MRTPPRFAAARSRVTNVLLFGLFAATLLGIARFHKHALPIALGGLGAVLLVRLALTDFALGAHLGHEAPILLNLAGLLLGFSVLADYFERSHLPERLTVVLPPGRLGAFALLVLVAVLSAVLDNIAAALIGGSAAITLFRRKVHIGYLAAIVAASNAGGAGSVIGDTTTTMIWIAGAKPGWVAEAAIGAVVAILFFGTVAAGQQHRLQPLVRDPHGAPPVDFGKVAMVALIIAGAMLANVFLDHNPAAGVWAAILLGGLWKRPNWQVLPGATVGMLFLVSLVMTASMMPVEELPEATQWTTFGLGFVSAFFDNIPLTALAIKQNAYDWGLLAFAVGYGGSMLWFGSSAGVAISGLFTEAKSAKNWLVQGWHVPVGYVLGFFALLFVMGWHPHPLAKAGGAHGDAPAHAVPEAPAAPEPAGGNR
ncbi:MAG: citrate transporter [Planctomycetes bacterium]|nr:citrate transporter [Planctomycetota bacterium]